MDMEKLATLEETTWRLHAAVCTLAQALNTPDLHIPEHHDSREDYIAHLENMVGIYREEVGKTYNAIDEWRDV